MHRKGNSNISGSMDVGYGYKRREKTLRDAGAERVWIDTDISRSELAALVDPDREELRQGYVLVVLDLLDLGPRRAALVKRLAARGVEVVVRGKAGKRLVTGHPGRPRSRFDPTPDQWADIEVIWADDKKKRPHKMAEISFIMGHPVAFWLVRDRASLKENT